MIILRNNYYSSSNKMSDKEFEATERNIKDSYKKGGRHLLGAGINAALATSLVKNAVKSKSKLAGVGGAIAAGNTAYHAYEAGKHIKEGFKTGRSPEYQKKLDEVIEKDDKKWDKDYEEWKAAKKKLKEQKKELKKQGKERGFI